jgi:hypothetical protein
MRERRRCRCFENRFDAGRRDAGIANERRETVLGIEPFVNRTAFGVRVDPARNTDRRKPSQGLVLAYRQPEFASRREKAVGLVDATRDQVVDEHADV